MRHGKKSRVLFAIAAAIGSLSCVFPSIAGEWELQEDGKRWKYLDASGEPFTETWLFLDGKEYYLDAKGYMKNGWLKDPDSGESYYMGADGAKCYNMFTPDNHYIGPDGTVLTAFDTYRKQLTKNLETFLKKEYASAENELGFLLTDLNGDSYPDVAVFDKVLQPERVLLAAVWNPETEVFAEITMADLDSEQSSKLSRNPEDSRVWLSIVEKNGDRNYFSLKWEGFQFVNEWNLETGRDDWGDVTYFVDGADTDAEEWYTTLEEAEKKTGDSLAVNLLPIEKTTILQAVNRTPEKQELYLWE